MGSTPACWASYSLVVEEEESFDAKNWGKDEKDLDLVMGIVDSNAGDAGGSGLFSVGEPWGDDRVVLAVSKELDRTMVSPLGVLGAGGRGGNAESVLE